MAAHAPVASSINVVLSCDANFSSHAGVALYSLLTNNPGRTFDIHVLSSGLSTAAVEKFVKLGTDLGANLDVHRIDADSWKALPIADRISTATYFRFLMPSILGSTTAKVLYLDCDLIVEGDIGPLWDMDVSGVVAAVCKDIGAHKSRHAALRLSRAHHYFNAGVLLINLLAWREERVSARCVEFLASNKERAIYLDQDALNVCIQEQVKYFSCIWNFMPFLKNTRFHEDFPAIQAGALKPAIIHYAGNVKPWHFPRESNPYVRQYWAYRMRSPWANEPVAVQGAQCHLPHPVPGNTAPTGQ